MKVEFAGMTDTGITRESNEDSFLISTSEALCVVADGMGGHRSGEVASAMAVETIREHYDQSLVDDAFGSGRKKFKGALGGDEKKRLNEAVTNSNSAIYEKASNNEDCRGMGTTIVGGYFLEDGVFIVHIGDSRCYRLRRGTLEQVTADHSLANEYLEMGILRAEEVEHFPYKNVITRAVGLNDAVEAEIQFENIEHNDVYLFCSDGLTDPINKAEIEYVLNSYREDLPMACRELIEAANRGGGPDNITVILAKTIHD